MPSRERPSGAANSQTENVLRWEPEELPHALMRRLLGGLLRECFGDWFACMNLAALLALIASAVLR
jgi:hypothetical protein